MATIRRRLAWQVRFTPKSSLPAGGIIDCWMERSYRLHFPSAAQPDPRTFGIPAGAQNAINVGSYTSRSVWPSINDDNYTNGTKRFRQSTMIDFGLLSGASRLEALLQEACEDE